MASLTKIMTAYTVVTLAARMDISLDLTIEISESCAMVQGTSANLRPGDVFTVEQLLYGLLLPSGNDAAYALASYFGGFLMKEKEPRNVMSEESEDENDPNLNNRESRCESELNYSNQVMSINLIRSTRDPFVAKNSQFQSEPELMEFISEMNKNCVRLNLRSTFFDSPHGMSNLQSRSTAFDIAKLSATLL